MAKTTCPNCGRDIPGKLKACVFCEIGKDAGKSAGGQWEKTESRQEQKEPEYREEKKHERREPKKTIEHILFGCPGCAVKIRIRYPIGTKAFKCSRCSLPFSVEESQNDPIVVVLVATREVVRTPPRPSLPPEVIAALRVFNLGQDASLGDVKARYKKCMTEYHPDKVAHLGEELRKLAAEKTRQFNDAYEYITKAFSKLNIQ